MALNTMKSRKCLTVDVARLKEKPGNHGVELPITLSNGRAMDQNQTAGYWRDNMDMDKLIEEFLAEHVNWIANRTPDWQFYIDPFMGRKSMV